VRKLADILLLLLLPFFLGICVSVSAQSWQWLHGNRGPSAEGWAVATDTAGNVFGGGFSLHSGVISFGSVTLNSYATTSTLQSIWVKYDAAGNALWADGTVSGNTWLSSITTDREGNLILLGSFNSSTMQIGPYILTNANTFAQYFLAKVSPSGTVLWAVKDGGAVFLWSYELSISIGCVGSVATDSAGNIYIASSFANNTTVGPYSLTNADPSNTTYDVLVAKYTPSGSPVWAKSIGGNSSDYVYGLTVAPSGNIYIAGAFFSSSVTVGPSIINNPTSGALTEPLAYIAEFSPSGTPLWAQAASGLRGSVAIGVASDRHGNIYVTGGFSDTIVSFGPITINRPYPGNLSRTNMFLVQYSPTNTATWGRAIGTATKPSWGYSVAAGPCGQVWVSGHYAENAVVAPGDTLAVATGTEPSFLVCYDQSGNVTNHLGVSAGSDDQNEVTCDASGNVFLCGDFLCSAIDSVFTLGTNKLSEPSGGGEYLFIAKYGAPDSVFNSNDTSVCNIPGGVVLTAPQGYDYYYWDNGATTVSRIITTPGKYWVSAVVAGCSRSILLDTFNVTVKSSASALRMDTAICAGKFITLHPEMPSGASCLWSTGSSFPNLTVYAPGVYWAIITQNGCQTTDSFHISEILPPTPPGFPKDTILCQGDVLSLSVQPAGTILWSNGSSQPEISVEGSGTFWVTVANLCGMTSDTVEISASLCDIGFPSAFTPNGDGRNDIIKIVSDGNLELYHNFSLSIFNRYGQRVFYTENIQTGWDGTFFHQQQDIGTYFYLISYTFEGRKHIKKGNFELIR